MHALHGVDAHPCFLPPTLVRLLAAVTARDAWARMLAFLKQYDVAGTATRAKAG